MQEAVPQLSVLVVNYNYGRYLTECLDSILSQTFTDFELIILDDASTDGSIEIAKPFLSDPRVSLVVHERNTGFTTCLIEGTEQYSRAPFRTMISADDIVKDPRALERQVELLQASEDRALCLTAYTTLSDGVERLHQPGKQDAIYQPKEMFQVLLNGFWSMQSGAMFRADAYFRSGGYRRDISIHVDIALYLSLCLQGSTAYCADPLYVYRLHAGQMSELTMPLQMRQGNQEIIRILNDACTEGERLGFITSDMPARSIRTHMRYSILQSAIYKNRRQALARIVSWFSIEPWQTLRTKGAWIGLARILLGQKAFDFLQAKLARVGIKSSSSFLQE